MFLYLSSIDILYHIIIFHKALRATYYNFRSEVMLWQIWNDDDKLYQNPRDWISFSYKERREYGYAKLGFANTYTHYLFHKTEMKRANVIGAIKTICKRQIIVDVVSVLSYTQGLQDTCVCG